MFQLKSNRRGVTRVAVDAPEGWDAADTAYQSHVLAEHGRDRLGDPEVADELDELIDALESVDWRRTPVLGTDTAAAFAHQVREARREVVRHG